MESDNKSGGATAAAAGGGGCGRLLVDESSSDIQSDRKRFQIDLKLGETTIVSWIKLLKESGIPVDQSPPPSPEPPKGFNEEDESRSECSNIVLKKEKEEQNYTTTEHCQLKKQRTAISQVLERINVVQVTKNTKMGHARVKSGSPCGLASNRAEFQSVTLPSPISAEHSLKNGRNELPDLNVPYTVQATSTSPRHIKDESCGMVNGPLLEGTILEMETMVADSRRLHGDVQDAVATKNRLPRELKQKLETVARLAHSSQGRISDELIMRLMSILGHWLKPRTLKRCLRDMVPCDLSPPCGWDAVRFIQIKKEIVEMIKLRNPSMETKDGSSNEIMELRVAHKAKYIMDHEMEDKVCDFYDIYVQGMDEVKSSEIRKFYIQLAAFWPKGTMDNHGIRNAICRAKERRTTLLQEKWHERGKRKKSGIAGVDNNLHGEVNIVAELERSVNDHNALVVPGTPEFDRNLGAPTQRFSPASAGSCQNLLKQGKFNILSETN